MKRRHLVLPAYLAIAACGGGTEPAENSTEQLDEAITQSDPAAAEAIEQAVDNGAGPQEALAAGGNAQAATVGGPQPATDSSKGAKPHSPGDPVPPPKIDAQANQASSNQVR